MPINTKRSILMIEHSSSLRKVDINCPDKEAIKDTAKARKAINRFLENFTLIPAIPYAIPTPKLSILLRIAIKNKYSNCIVFTPLNKLSKMKFYINKS